MRVAFRFIAADVGSRRQVATLSWHDQFEIPTSHVGVIP